MIKKIWISLLLGILFVWVSFADILPDPTIPEEKCIMFDSVDVGNWRVISFNKKLGEIREERAKECLSDEIISDNNFVLHVSFELESNSDEIISDNGFVIHNEPSVWKSNIEFYVLDYDIDVDDISVDNIGDKAEKILINRWERPHRTLIWRYPMRHEYVYQIILNWSGLYEAQLIWENRIDLREKNPIYIGENPFNGIKHIGIKVSLTRFIKDWARTVLIETLLLFLIAKLCRKSWSIKNRKIIVTWILASTVTLPLLRFVLPMFFSNYLLYVIIWEILVTVIETFIIKYSLKIERKMAIFTSIICNLCSFIVWLFIF